MDEATSSLDSITERFIQDKLDEIMEDKSVVVVAHRLSTVAHLDRILVFDKGGWLRVAVMTSCCAKAVTTRVCGISSSALNWARRFETGPASTVAGARVMLRSTGAVSCL